MTPELETLGQGVAQGAQLAQMPQGGWAWMVRE